MHFTVQLILHSDRFSWFNIAAYIVRLVHGLAARIWFPRVRASLDVNLLVLKDIIDANCFPRYGVIPLVPVGRIGVFCFG